MDTIKFTNAELYGLSREINMLLSERLNILVKYKLTELFDIINNKFLKTYQEFRDKSIKELEPSGNIPSFIEKDGKQIPNPKLEKFMKKMKPIDDDVKEINFRKLDISLIKNIETNNNYPLLFRLFSFEETAKK